MVVLTAGVPTVTHTLLDGLGEGQALAWIAKDDPASFPPDLAARLAARADILFCNGGERPMVEAARVGTFRSGQWLIKTRSGDGVLVEAPGCRQIVPVARVVARDATGAGDTFAERCWRMFLRANAILLP